MSRNFYDGTDAELYSGGQSFATKIAEDPEAFGLTTAQATAYAAKSAAYAAAYVIAIAPDTRTRASVAIKNQQRQILRAASASLAKVIDGTPTVTDAMKISLGLNVRAQPHPIPVPATSPDVDVQSVISRTVRLRLHDSTNETRRGRPVGVASAAVYSYVGPTAPAEPEAYKFEGIFTRVSSIEITFPDSVPSGATVWVSARWLNARGQPGPACDPQSLTLQGGAARAAA